MDQQHNTDTSTLKQPTSGAKKKRPSWPPGVSGNPAGRTPGLPSIDRALREGLCRRNETGGTPMELIVSNLVDGALKGDLAASIAVIQLAYLKPIVPNIKSITKNKKIV
jgi:hypothetical protein